MESSSSPRHARTLPLGKPKIGYRKSSNCTARNRCFGALSKTNRFSTGSFVRRIPSAVAFEQLGAANRLTLELNDYDWYTAALDMQWPQPDNTITRLRALKQLADDTPCYVLGIDRSAGVAPVVDQIMTCLEGSRRAVGDVTL